MSINQSIEQIEKILGYTFKDKRLIASALTHPSAAEGLPVSASYERLEFLGDSVLGAMVAKDLFERFPDMDECALTRMKISLVSGPALSKVADSLGMGPLIEFGESEKGTGTRGLHSALENVFESVVGALYLDAGYDVTHAFVRRVLDPYVSEDLALTPISPKSKLQEVIQRDYKCAPTYQLVDSKGPAHSPTFISEVLVGDKAVGKGSGHTKKESESQAALDALSQLGYLPNLQRKTTSAHTGE